ncbi:PAS fold-containing protein [Methylobacterium sp. ap11]|uniref:PAS domain-containing protein n=1 Tax=Methylobacterium sp. ap11 TaxID=1761799 RepID=UPI0008B1061A|nr:PAS domain-containing protein [Methylobacterium sp. ap11]SEP44118.1 PAS fold-containing protein [Methylobacterium sp. ap11]
MRERGTGRDEPPPGALAAACAAPDAVATWQWDIGADILCGDDRMAALYGVDPASLRGGAPVPLLLDRIHPDDRATVVTRIRRAAEEGGSYVVPYRLLAPGGQIRWVLSCGRCAHDAAGRPTEGRGVVIDLTGAETHPLERAAEHGLAVRRAVDDWHDPFLRRLADMLLMEIGRHLAAGDAEQSPENRWTN